MRLRVLAVAAVLAGPAAARADEPAPGGPSGAAPLAPPPPEQRTSEVSYAYQTLIMDGIAAALAIGGFAQVRAGDAEEPIEGLAVGALGAMVYGLGAPIVHIANGRFETGIQSFAVRLGLVLAFGAIGNRLGPKGGCDLGCDRSATGIAIGAGVGALTAAVVDAILLARKPAAAATPRIAPSLAAGATGLMAGIGGSF